MTGARSHRNAHHGLAGKCQHCHKNNYRTRADAKLGAKQAQGRNGAGGRLNGEVTRMHPYPCPHDTGMFHIGHLPRDVRNGVLDREEYAAIAEAKARRTG